MNFLPSSIEKYAELFSAGEDPVLKELNRETHIKTLFPRMLSGKMQGKLLQFLSQMIRPSYILEIGTFTAYSTICLARGLNEGGSLDTIEVNEELEDIINKYLHKAGVADKVMVHYGDAQTIIPGLQNEYDLVFIDADKENYLNYYLLVVEKVRKGGFIIADNVLWSGKVADESVTDKDTGALRRFNVFVQGDERVENLLLPFRDGLMICRKR
jgi:predicted O-methyltransferase YrrM